MKKITLLHIILFLSLMSCLSSNSVKTSETQIETKTVKDVKYSGLRSSSYGIYPFPHPEGWKHAFNKLQNDFPDSETCGIWIISNINTENSECILEFPRNEGDTKEYKNIVFSSIDKHEPYLTYFDQNNIKVFLQVESGQGSMEDLIDIILTRYGHHPSVVGFGVDLEWYDPHGNVGMNGETFFTPLRTKTAEKWDSKIKSYNPEYRLFLKHWLHSSNIMPQYTKSDIIFINDAQDFSNLTGGNAKEAMTVMADNFDQWAAHFRRDGYIRAVGYQIGYDSDKNFWQDILGYPYPKNYAKIILDRIPKEQEVSIFWVDFSMNDVFMQDYNGPTPIVPLDLIELGENYTKGSQVKASSREGYNDKFKGSMATDNNLVTRWASLASDKEWVEIELTKKRDIKTIVLFWETAFSKRYSIESSLDGTNWTEVYYEKNSDGNEDYINLNITAKYIRIQSLERATEWGVSIYEIGIYGKSNI